MHHNKEHSKIDWIDSKHQLANSLTKVDASSEKLLRIFKIGKNLAFESIKKTHFIVLFLLLQK